MRRFTYAVVLVCAAAVPALTSEPAAAAALDELVTDRPVSAMVREGGRLYLGGSFRHIGPFTGSGVALEPTSGAVDKGFPVVNGPVLAAQPDGAGGFYIGGNFSRVGSVPRRSLAHVRASGAVDPHFDPSPSGPVFAVALDAGRLYVGGDFGAIGGRSRNRLAALDAVTGAVDRGFDPSVGFQGVPEDRAPMQLPMPPALVRRMGYAEQPRPPVCTYGYYFEDYDPYFSRRGVLALAVYQGRLYIGGSFSSVTGVQRDNLAVVDAATGDLDPDFDPDFNSPGFSPRAKQRRHDTDGPVDALAVADGRLYVAGRFSTVAGRSRLRLAALDALSGGVDREFDPVPSARVLALAVHHGRLYAAGRFSRIGDLHRGKVAALDPLTGLADPAFAVQPDGAVNVLAPAGDKLYIGGDFEHVDGKPRARLAAIEAASGALDLGFDPNADAPVAALAAGGSHVYAGGLFESVGGLTRHGLAAIDMRTGGLDAAFAPEPRLDVTKLAAAGGRLFAAGSATDGQPSRPLYSFDGRSGQLSTRFRPAFEARPQALAAHAGRVFVAGEDRATGQPSPLLALNANDGARLRRFRPRLRGDVHALEPAGGRLFVGGVFRRGRVRTVQGRRIEPPPSFGLAALDPMTGRRERGFRPDLPRRAERYAAVFDLRVGAGSLYATGQLAGESGARRPLLEALNLRTGSLRPRFKAPAIRGSALAVGSGRLVVNGTSGGRRGLSVLDAATGELDRRLSSLVSGSVCSVETGAGRAFAGGEFNTLGGEYHPNLASVPFRGR